MPLITITFPKGINVSLQVGDLIYATEIRNDQAGKNHPNSTGRNTKPRKYGIVKLIDRPAGFIRVDTTGFGSASLGEGNNHYLMFSKDNRGNLSGMIGYYAETTYKNHSTLPSEIFATAVDYVESSK